MFDIEYYLKPCKNSLNWMSEIHCLSIIEGIAHFLKDMLSDNDFVFEEFVNDASEIQEIRKMLYESNFDNRPRPSKESTYFHNKTFRHALEKKD